MAGHNMIKMSELTAMFISLEFKDTKTYIQSGNVLFSHTGKLSAAELSGKIEKAILEKFGFPILAMTRTDKELVNLLSLNPYLNEPEFDPAKNAVVFLHEKPTGAQIEKVNDIDFPPDKFTISGNEIFIYCPNGFGKTKLYTNFFERKMRVTGTARNWKTITTILNLIGHSTS
jgi:uncharacterized protein (DUF1697 family)